MGSLKRLVIVCASFGAGFAICLTVVWFGVEWYKSRPQSWNTSALKGTFEGMEFKTQPRESSYLVTFLYDIENHTNKTYEVNPRNLALLAVLSDGNAFSKEAGSYQTSAPIIEGTDFIPAKGKARFRITVAYEYPSDATMKDKDDTAKVAKSVNRRLREFSGFVAFDQINHYRIELPEGWKKWEDVKKAD